MKLDFVDVHVLADGFCTVMQLPRIILRNALSINAQSTISTLNGRSDSEKSSDSPDIKSSDLGLSPRIAISKSENFFAFRDAREPKTKTLFSGTCRFRISRTIFQCSGLRSTCGEFLLITDVPPIFCKGRMLLQENAEFPRPLPAQHLHCKYGWFWTAFACICANRPIPQVVALAHYQCV